MKKRSRVDLYLPLPALPDQARAAPQPAPVPTPRAPRPSAPEKIGGGCLLYRLPAAPSTS